MHMITSVALILFHRPNISLSTATTELTLPTSHTPYIPPHPQRGTPYHRYAIFLLPQQSPTEPIEVPAFGDADRLGFDLRAFADKYGLDGSKGGGAHMWREIWDPTVSQIYKETLSKYLRDSEISWTNLVDLFIRTQGARVWTHAEAGSLCPVQADLQILLASSSGRSFTYTVTYVHGLIQSFNFLLRIR
jgi:hypothetical protein